MRYLLTNLDPHAVDPQRQSRWTDEHNTLPDPGQTPEPRGGWYTYTFTPTSAQPFPTVAQQANRLDQYTSTLIARLRRRLRETELQEDIDWIEGELDGLTCTLVSSWRREAYLRARLQINQYVTAPSSPTESAVPAELHVQQEEQVPLATHRNVWKAI